VIISLILAAALHPDGTPNDWARTLSGEPLRTAVQEPPPAAPRKEENLRLNVAAHIRYAIPFGSADRSEWIYGPGIVVVDQNLSWADFFDPGWGLDVEIDLFFSNRGTTQSPGVTYGVMLMLQTDEFGGERINGVFNNSVTVDDMTMNSLLVGGKVIHTLGGGFYADGHIAIGAVHYTAVEGTFSGPALPQFRDSVFEDTWTFASQFRGHVGYRAGPVGIALGLGFRIQAPPEEGSRVSFESGAFWTFDLELGVELGF
jgi:hypothetical protein